MSPAAEPLTPDAGEALRLWLRSESEIAALVGTRVALTLTGDQPAIRYALLGPTGAGLLQGGAAAVRYQVECWGAGGNAPDDGKSLEIARTVMRLTPKFCGVFGGATVAGASARYPSSNPDPTTKRPRHIVEVSFIATP